MSSLIETAVRGLPATGDAIFVAGKQFDQFAQWFSALDPQMQLFAAGIAAISPQVFKLTKGFLKQKTSLFSVTDGFKKIDEAGKKASGSLVNGMTGVQAAIDKAVQAQLEFDNSLRGSSLTKLNQVTRQAKSELEGYWSMTGKAEKAANNYVKALRAQKQEQEAINRLVKPGDIPKRCPAHRRLFKFHPIPGQIHGLQLKPLSIGYAAQIVINAKAGKDAG